MLLQFVVLYLIVSVAIGLYAATKVKNSADFVVAGRHLPLPFIIATVFATWFGSETVLGIPSKFLNEGLKGVVADPFGSSMCLIFVGLFFARPLYRMGLLTIGQGLDQPPDAQGLAFFQRSGGGRRRQRKVGHAHGAAC